jgi:hypothetical protein
MLRIAEAIRPLPASGYRIHTSRLRFAVKRDSLSAGKPMEGSMAVVAYGLGRFGDRRLEKGGPGCTRRWWHGQARVSAALAVTGLARCSFAGFFTTRR